MDNPQNNATPTRKPLAGDSVIDMRAANWIQLKPSEILKEVDDAFIAWRSVKTPVDNECIIVLSDGNFEFFRLLGQSFHHWLVENSLATTAGFILKFASESQEGPPEIKTAVCECCGWESEEVVPRPTVVAGDIDRINLCPICSRFNYQNRSLKNHPGQIAITAYCANILRAEILELKDEVQNLRNQLIQE